MTECPNLNFEQTFYDQTLFFLIYTCSRIRLNGFLPMLEKYGLMIAQKLEVGKQD